MTTKRGYQKTHPWVNFTFDLRRAPAQLWVLLGQVVARCEQLAAAVLPPEQSHKMNLMLITRGAHSTIAIEGSTLTRDEVRAIAEGRLELPPSREHLQREANNVLRTYGDILSSVEADDLLRLTPERIGRLNGGILEGLEDHLEEGVIPGEVRTQAVGVGRYRAVPAEDCQYLLARLCQWLDGDSGEWARLPSIVEHERENEVAKAVLQSIVAHLYLAWIHPFGDGNGRTARAVEYMILARAKLPTVASHLPTTHYALTRQEYYRQLDRASRANSAKGDVIGFVTYALQGFVDGLRTHSVYLAWVQSILAWEHLVHDSFGRVGQSKSMVRRRDLVLALGRQSTTPEPPAPVPKWRLTALNETLAEHYEDLSSKTLSRDLAWLKEKGLIREEAEGYHANIDIMTAFRLG